MLKDAQSKNVQRIPSQQLPLLRIDFIDDSRDEERRKERILEWVVRFVRKILHKRTSIL